LDKRAATEQRQFYKSCRQTGGGTGMKEPSQVSNLKLADKEFFMVASRFSMLLFLIAASINVMMGPWSF
jgi:hypothetical protein